MARTKTSPAEPEKYVDPLDRKNGPWDDYDIQRFLRTLAEANKIRANPSLMKRVRAEAQKQVEVAKATAASTSK